MFTDTLKNENFNNLAAIIRVPFQSQNWKRNHPEVPFWSMVENFSKSIKPAETRLDRERVIKHFTKLIAAIAQADDRLKYTPADLDWFIGVLDTPDADARATLNLFSTWFSASDEYVTPGEVAEATNTHESNWRNKAADGEIPGCVKKGKQWLLPVSVLRSRGVNVEFQRRDNEPDNDGESEE